MSAQREIDAALAWADRIERGDAEWNSYIVALAGLAREQREYIAGLEQAIRLPTEGDVTDWREVVTKLHVVEQRIAELTNAIDKLNPDDLRGAGRLSLDGIEYRIVEESELKHVARAMTNIRDTLAKQ